MRPVLLIAAVCLSLACHSQAETTYYVDWDRGDDAAAGTAEAPWKTPWHASERVRSGDTVIIHARDDGKPYHRPGCGPAVIEAQLPRTRWLAAEGETVRLSSTPEFGIAPWEHCDGKGSTTVGRRVPWL